MDPLRWGPPEPEERDPLTQTALMREMFRVIRIWAHRKPARLVTVRIVLIAIVAAMVLPGIYSLIR